MQHSIEFAVATPCTSSDRVFDYGLLTLKNGKFSIPPKCSLDTELNAGFTTQIFCYLKPSNGDIIPSFLNGSNNDRSDYMLLGKSSGFIEIIVDYRYKIENGLSLEPDFSLECYPAEISGDRRPDYLIVGLEYMNGLLYCCMGSGRIYVYPLNLPSDYVQEENFYSISRCRELLTNQIDHPIYRGNGKASNTTHINGNKDSPDSETKYTSRRSRHDSNLRHCVQEGTAGEEEEEEGALHDTHRHSQHRIYRHRNHGRHHHRDEVSREDERFYRIIAYRGKSKLRHLCYYLPFADKPSSTLPNSAVKVFQNYRSRGVKVFRPCIVLNIEQTISEFHINPFDSLSFVITAPRTPIMMRKIVLDSSYVNYFETLMKIKKVAQKLSPIENIHWDELAVKRGYSSLLDWLIYEAAYEQNRMSLLSWKKVIEMKGTAILGTTIVWRQSTTQSNDDLVRIVTDNAFTRDGATIFSSREHDIAGSSIPRSRLLQRRRRRIFDTPVSSNYRVEAFLKRAAKNTFTVNFKVFKMPSRHYSNPCPESGSLPDGDVGSNSRRIIHHRISGSETAAYSSGGNVNDNQHSSHISSLGPTVVRSVSQEESNEDPSQTLGTDSVDDIDRSLIETSTHISSESEQDIDTSSAYESDSNSNNNNDDDGDGNESTTFYYGLNRNPNLHNNNIDDRDLSGNYITTFLPAKYERMCIFSIDHFLSLQSFKPKLQDEPVFRIDSFPKVSEFIKDGFLSQEDIVATEIISHFNAFKKLYMLSASLCLIIDANGVLILDSKNVQDFDNLIKNDPTALKVASARLGLITDSILILEKFDKCEDCLSFNIEFTLIVACLPRSIKAFRGTFKAHSKIGRLKLLDIATLSRTDRYVDKVQLIACGHSQNGKKRRQESFSELNASKKLKREG